MYLHLGQDTVVRKDGVVGVFDLDNSSRSVITREFLRSAEKTGAVVTVTEELPKSFVVCAEKGGARVYLSQLAPQTLQRRSETSEIF